MSTADCSANTIRVSFIKCSNDYASTELFSLFSLSNDLLYSSPSPQDNTIGNLTVCLTRTDNLLYSLIMTNATEEWDWDSWLEIRGPYDNVVFKSVFWGGVFRISLAMPIEKGSEWKWTTTFVPGWYMNMDESWDASVSGSYPATDAPHYFYRIFSGYDFMAAYELRILYRYGVVAYINGIEVYRDNLPVGPILPTTKSSTSYVYYQYRGTIRNGYEISASTNVLAIEVHTSSNTEIEFDAWLAVYTSSDTFNGINACYPVVPTSGFWNDGFNMAGVFDYNANSGVTINAFSPGIDYVEFSVPTAQINTFNILVYRTASFFSNMQWKMYDIVSGKWTDLYTSAPITSTSSMYNDVVIGDWSSPNTNKVRFYPMKASGLPAWMIEYIPRVCYMEYSLEQKIPQFKESYELKKDEYISLKPTNWNNTSTCTSTPTLPEGLSFSACAIEGTPTTLLEQTTFTIFISDNMGTKYLLLKLAIVEPTPDGNNGNNLGTIILIVVIVVIVIVVILVVFCLVHKRKMEVKPRPIPPAPISNPTQPVIIDTSVPVGYPMKVTPPYTLDYSSHYGDVNPDPIPSAPDHMGDSTGYNPSYVDPSATPGYSVVSTPAHVVLGTPANPVFNIPGTYAVIGTPANPAYSNPPSVHVNKVSVLVPSGSQSIASQESMGRSMLYSNPDTENRAYVNPETSSHYAPDPVVNNGRAGDTSVYVNWEALTEEEKAKIK